MLQKTKSSSQSSNQKKWMPWLGGGLLVLSCLVYATFLVMAFLPLSAGGKVTLGTVIVLVGEETAWLGTMLVGASVVARYKRFLNPKRWFHHDEIAQGDTTDEHKNL